MSALSRLDEIAEEMTEEDKRAEAELSRGCMSCTTGCGIVLVIFLVALIWAVFR